MKLSILKWIDNEPYHKRTKRLGLKGPFFSILYIN